MSTDTNTQVSPLEICRAALTLVGMDPSGLESVDVVQGGYGACDSYDAMMSDGTRLHLKALMPGADAEQLAALRKEARFYSRLAPRLPIRVPAIRSLSTNEKTGVVIVMDAGAQPLAPADWTEALYNQAAADLARMHAAFWGKGDTLDGLRFLPRRSTDVTEEEIAHARECWAHVAAEPRFQDIMTADQVAAIDGWIPTVAGVLAGLEALPETLIHGDCHTGNITLGEDGALVWANWSGASIGRGLEDLSFLYQRAGFAGGQPPWDAMLAAYHESLQAAMPETPSIDAVRKAAEASEWAVRLLQWPHYMDYASPETLKAFLCRMDDLAESVRAGTT